MATGGTGAGAGSPPSITHSGATIGEGTSSPDPSRAESGAPKGDHVGPKMIKVIMVVRASIIATCERPDTAAGKESGLS